MSFFIAYKYVGVILPMLVSHLMLANQSYEHPLVVLITAYNNAAWVRQTLDSVCTQQYHNFRIIYIDDASTDGSAQQAQEYLASVPVAIPVTFIRNKTRMRKLYNVYHAIHSGTADHEIIFMLDGDDWLAHDHVLSHINQLYQNPDVWITYGQDQPSSMPEARKWWISLNGNCTKTPDHIIETNAFREYHFVYMHPRTFYAWLFKAIKKDDLLALAIDGFIGDFYPVCNDFAILYPMLEMAGRHILFNPEVLYLYNVENPLSGFKKDRTLQQQCGREIRSRARYVPLAHPVLSACTQGQ
jgi:glycosyltransferase involved in cell wall biosynthesis